MLLPVIITSKLQNSPIMKTNQIAQHLFEYLLEVKKLTYSIKRDIYNYNDFLLWQKELPNGKGCDWRSHEHPDRDYWLRVEKQNVSAEPPILPPDLIDWVEQESLRNIKERPKPFSSIVILSAEEQEKLQELETDLESLISTRSELSDPNSELQKQEESLADLDKEIGLKQRAWENLKKREKESFEEDENRVLSWENWVTEEWVPWAKKQRIQNLYNKLFSIYQRLQREENIEFLWGHGLIVGKVDEEIIRRPLFTTRLNLQFDAQNAIFNIHPSQRETSFERDMLSSLDLPQLPEESSDFLEKVNEGIDPLSDEANGLLIKFANLLGGEHDLEEIIAGSEIELSEQLIIHNAPVIFIRPSGRLWLDELEQIANHYKEDGRIPQTIQSYLTERDLEPEVDDQSRWSEFGKDLYFPLVANHEQKSIPPRLENEIGVVIQGPPGTGKSHTIVNLLAHLLAHGKKVLVTSQTKRALRIIGEMLQKHLPEIKPLCVNRLGGDRKSIEELEASIKTINEKYNTIQVEKSETEKKKLEIQLDKQRREISSLETQLKQRIQEENESSPNRYPEWLSVWISNNVGNSEVPASRLAQWIDREKRQGDITWIPDRISHNDTIPFNSEDLKEFYRLSGILSEGDVQAYQHDRPDLDFLPTAQDLKKLISETHKFKRKVDSQNNLIEDWVIPENKEFDFQVVLPLIKQALKVRRTIQEEWVNSIIHSLTLMPEELKDWKRFHKEMEANIKEIRDRANEIHKYDISTPDIQTIDFEQTQEDLKLLHQYFREKGELGKLFWLTHRNLRYLHEEYQVDNHAIRSAKEVRAVYVLITILKVKYKLSITWENRLESHDGPKTDPNNSQFEQVFREHLNDLKDALDWFEDFYLHIRRELQGINIPDLDSWSKVRSLQKLFSGLKIIQAKHELRQKIQKIQQLADELKAGKDKANAHSNWGALSEALKHGDLDQWEENYQELKRVQALSPRISKLLELKRKLEEVAPLWASQIMDKGGEGQPLPLPHDWQKAWVFRRVEDWLESYNNKLSSPEIRRQLEKARQREKELIRKLVAKRAWLSVKKKLDKEPEVRKSLPRWLDSIEQIGKGYSKYKQRYLAQARKHMSVAQEAAPVWVMPIDYVIENFESNKLIFDVVIVDEGSQCDPLALAALSRAKRIIIFGDEKQNAPPRLFVNRAQIFQLIDEYIQDIPYQGGFNFGSTSSLYHLAKATYGSNLMLKEHFRCAPEIINFSNDRFYQGEIEPLRIPTKEERLDPTVETVFIPDGYRKEQEKINPSEAEGIVSKIKELCEKQEYDDRSMGVISLLGDEQSQFIENLLRETIGGEEMAKRRLICGDARDFQGDERDIIFLSMVVANNVRFRALTDKRAQRRFNVAASRARDQMWLFHSVNLDDLGGPNDLRYQLLDYCRNPYRVEFELEKAQERLEQYNSSEFHQEVHRLIISKGYRAIPEVPAGKNDQYRIDTVIEGNETRLAVECDGDRYHGPQQWEDDYERQTALERIGWDFWRIRASEFYLDKEKAMESLWEKP